MTEGPPYDMRSFCLKRSEARSLWIDNHIGEHPSRLATI
jgi:hypothetical protein